MKQRAKIKSVADGWEVTYSDGLVYTYPTLPEAHTVSTRWELDQVKSQQEVSG